jgi:hypothetical protein
VLDGAHFKGRVFLNIAQLLEDKRWWTFGPAVPKVMTSTSTTWYALEELFKASGNLKAQNEAYYQRRLLAYTDVTQTDESAVGNFWSWAFWGYGVRPARLLAWILLVFAIFTFIYWRELPPAVTSRFARAAMFSLNNSWKWKYGFDNAQTPLFKAITLTQSIATKVLLICLLQALSNVSPVLNSIAGKFIPFA